ncbi:MoxR family ATPase [Candidatus Woesearchaeota archaeon]|nr:MoxR family ATPase [Candidatus Woesearchaeota archaeon]
MQKAKTINTGEKKSEFNGKCQLYNEDLQKAREEISKAVVGQDHVVNSLFRALIASGNVLLEGVPGIAKTLLVKTLASVTGCSFKRIQFTADLLPTDITGITAYDEKKGFYVVKGPIFSNFVLADEINRAPPKAQSALLECMQEKQATIGKETYNIDRPFFVLATQNPIESLGTYPLPEAQVDRFLFKLNIMYPDINQEKEILEKNMTLEGLEKPEMKIILTKEKLLAMQSDVHKIFMDDKVRQYLVSLVDATRFPKNYHLKMGKYIEWGCSPRASIGLFIAAKAEALMNNRNYVTPNDVKTIAHDVLRHRILLNYEGQSEGINSDSVIDEILEKVPIP